MDQVKAQIASLETWRDSAQKQLNKLFSGLRTVEDMVRGVEDMVRGYIKSSEAHNKEVQAKLDQLIDHQTAADKKDAAHDLELEKAAEDRDSLREIIKGMVSQEMNNKGLPNSGKKLYGCVGIAGAVGSAIMTVMIAAMPHLPEIGDFIVKILRGIHK